MQNVSEFMRWRLSCWLRACDGMVF
jgi:hypothetical protein